MTADDARRLMDWQEPSVVTIERGGATWTGRVVGIVTQPSLILEDDEGRRTTVALDGAEVVRDA